YAEPPPPGLVPSCAEGGVLGVLPGIIGSIQAMETIKLVLGVGEPLIGRLVLFDALKLQFRELKLEKDPDCPVCGSHPTVTGLLEGAEPAGRDRRVGGERGSVAAALLGRTGGRPDGNRVDEGTAGLADREKGRRGDLPPCLFNPAVRPSRCAGCSIQTASLPVRLSARSAEGGTRTPTGLRPLRPERSGRKPVGVRVPPSALRAEGGTRTPTGLR